MLIDRIVHNSEVIIIDGDSYRLKESKEQNDKRKQARSKHKLPATSTTTKGEEPDGL